MRRSAARRLLGRTISHAWNSDIFSESAAAAFWQTLSLPPLLLGIFGILGYVGGVFGPDTVAAVQQWIIELTGGVFSQNALNEIIAPTVADVLSTARGEVVSIGFLLSFWSGSSAMSAFVDAVTRAHDQYEVRNLVWQRVLAMLMYVVGLITGIIALPLVALGPERVLALLPGSSERAVGTAYAALYYPVIGLVLLAALTTLYKVALPLKPPWYRGLPGALLALLVFLAGASGLRLYLDWLTGTGYTYGALAAPIAFLLATFFIAFAIIFGAHLNAGIQALWPVPLHDRRGRLKKSGPGTPELRRAVHQNPEAAAALLEQLAYTVGRPERAGTERQGHTSDRRPAHQPRDSPLGQPSSDAPVRTSPTKATTVSALSAVPPHPPNE
ncbi:membrane protein [Modestobacter sp. DSM 44400]|nr:membrane protein [Modestobacter sp. DSM 44400]